MLSMPFIFTFLGIQQAIVDPGCAHPEYLNKTVPSQKRAPVLL